MTKSSKTIQKNKTFREYLTPEYLAICNDAIVAQDQSVTLVRLIDQIVGLAFPIQLTRFVIVAQFVRQEELTLEEFTKAGLVHKLVLVNPKGEKSELGEFLTAIDSDNPWTTTRSITDLSGQVAVKEEGVYTFKVLGRTHDSDFEELIAKKVRATLSTGLPGLYLAEFSADPSKRDEQKQGGGYVLVLPNGRIQGGDGGYNYQGTYRTEDDVLIGKLNVRRHNPEVKSVFGDIEEFDLDLKGETTASGLLLEGCRTDKPSERIWITLHRQALVPSTK